MTLYKIQELNFFIQFHKKVNCAQEDEQQTWANEQQQNLINDLVCKSNIICNMLHFNNRGHHTVE